MIKYIILGRICDNNNFKYNCVLVLNANMLNMDHVTNFQNTDISYITTHFEKLPRSDAFRTSKIKTSINSENVTAEQIFDMHTLGLLYLK